MTSTVLSHPMLLVKLLQWMLDISQLQTTIDVIRMSLITMMRWMIAQWWWCVVLREWMAHLCQTQMCVCVCSLSLEWMISSVSAVLYTCTSLFTVWWLINPLFFLFSGCISDLFLSCESSIVWECPCKGETKLYSRSCVLHDSRNWDWTKNSVSGWTWDRLSKRVTCIHSVKISLL